MSKKIYFFIIIITFIFISCNQIEKVNDNDISKTIELYENGILRGIENFDKQGNLIENIDYDTYRNIMYHSIHRFNEKGEKIKSIYFQKGNIFSGEAEYIYNDGKEMGYISSNSEGTKLRFINSYNNNNLVASYTLSTEDDIINYTTYSYDSAYRKIEENEYVIDYADLGKRFPNIHTELLKTKKYYRDSLGQLVKSSILNFSGFKYPDQEEHLDFDSDGNIVQSRTFENKKLLKNDLFLSKHFIYIYLNSELIKKIDVLNNDSIIFSKKEKIFNR